MAPLALRLGAPPDGDLTFVHAVHGGTVVADVVSQTSAKEAFARKSLGAARNEDFRVECAQATSSGLLDWVVASWGSKPPRRDGAVLACDLDYLVHSERGFTGALIAATAFPAFDAAAKTAGRLSVTFAPLTILTATDPATKLAVNLATGAKQTQWLTSNFRLEIDGLDCTKVSRIDPFVVSRPIERVESHGSVGLVAGPIDFPSLRITLSAVSAGSWLAWHQDFVVAGNNGPAGEKHGVLTLLASNLQTELAHIELSGLGIFRLTTDPPEDASPSQVARWYAELYCEQMTLVPGSP